MKNYTEAQNEKCKAANWELQKDWRETKLLPRPCNSMDITNV